jgi:hypothetical protein
MSLLMDDPEFPDFQDPPKDSLCHWPELDRTAVVSPVCGLKQRSQDHSCQIPSTNCVFHPFQS